MTLHDAFFESPQILSSRVLLISDSLNRDIDSALPDWLDWKSSLTSSEVIVCGSVCHEEIRVLAQICEIAAIVDDELSKSGRRLFGFPCISTSQWIELAKKNPKSISIILVPTLRSTRHFIKQCLQHNLNYITPIQLLLLLKKINHPTGISGRFFRYGISYLEFVLKNTNDLLAQSEKLSDNYSKIGFLSYLLYRLTLNPNFLEPVAVGRGWAYDYNAYLFDKSYLKIGTEEIFVDCGAYTGDSIAAFLEGTNGSYKHIYSFEASPANNEEIRRRITLLQKSYLKDLSSSISVIEKGVWSSTCDLTFVTNELHDLGGHLKESGAEIFSYDPQLSTMTVVPVTTIDEATSCDATFIKMEVEGSELEGLKGARKTICKNKPKLSIPVYHKPEDILALPSFIESLDLGYKIGFRQHDLYKPDATYLYCY